MLYVKELIVSTYESELRQMSLELNNLSITLRDSIKSNIGVDVNFYINRQIPSDRVNKVMFNNQDNRFVCDIV